MKIIYSFLLILLSLSVANAQTSVIEQELYDYINGEDNEKMIDVNIVLKSKMDSNTLRSLNLRSVDKESGRELVVSELKKFSKKTQSEIISILKAEERGNGVTNITTHWLVNMINCTTTADVIYTIAEHPDVKEIILNNEEKMIWDENPIDNVDLDLDGGIREITNNVTQVNADKVWDLGYTGKGVVVAVIDSGVNYKHVDLADHLWDGGDEYPYHGYDFVNDDNDPMDDHYHGTHCAGTICGDGTAGSKTGVAPDANLMCIKVLNANGRGNYDDLLSGVEFAVEHGADVLSLSLGWAAPKASISELQRELFTNVLQANVIAAVAAGNDGYYETYPRNIHSPGNCPPPWIHPDQKANPGGLSAVVCVGAVDSNDEKTDFSSQGPVTWQETSWEDYKYEYKSGLMNTNGWLHYDKGDNVTAVGNSYYVKVKWGIKITAEDLQLHKNSYMTKVSVYDYVAHTGNILIYKGGDSAPEELVHTQPYTCTGAKTYVEFDLTSDILIEADKNIWVVMNNDSEVYVAAACNATHDKNGRWFNSGGTWMDILNNLTPLQYTWMLRAYVTSESKDNEDKRAESDFGLIRPDICAPGYYIKSCYNIGNNSYTHLSGTSMATPCVAGVMALMLEKDSSLTPAEICEKIEMTSKKLTEKKSNYTGSGRIDALAAIKSIKDIDAPTELSLTKINANSVRLDWTEVPQATSYNVYHNGTMIKNVSENTCVINDLVYNYIDTFSVTSVNNESESDHSIEINNTKTVEDCFMIDCDGYSLKFTIQNTSPKEVSVLCSTAPLTSTNLHIPNIATTYDEVNFNVVKIEQKAFEKMLFAGTVTISDNVREIGNSAFEECDNLTRVEMGNSVTSIGDRAFYGCSSLKSLYCYAENLPETGEGVIYDCFSGLTIYVPAQFVDAYKAASPWNSYTIKPIGVIENHWTVDESAYANNMSLIGLVQIDGVNQNTTYLELGAFCGEEVRGSNLIQYIPALDKYLVFLTVHGNDNDEISFKLYDHSSEEVMDLRSPEAITFAVNGTLGSIETPYVLNFSNMVNITASVNPEDAGSIEGAGEYGINDVATLTATPNFGYEFTNWTENGEIVSTDAEYLFTVTEARNLVANFTLLTYEVTASANPAEGGSINGAGTYTHGETATLTATANEGYEFTNWTENGTIVSTDAEYSFTVTEAKELVANFTLLTYEVTASANPAEGGSINGAGTYTHGETATLTATANEGFSFKNWTVNGNVVSTNSEYTFTVTDAKELVANFNCVQSRYLKSGWNWFSSYIEISGEEGLEILENALGENGLQIKSQTAFVANSSAGWYGSLTSVSVESMYMLQTSAAHELTLAGDKVNPENHPIAIGNNWRWISYLLSESIDVEEALATINPNHGDYVKSKNAFSQYYNGIGWLGALNTMNPGEGYMYQNTSGTTKTLVYPSSASKGTRANVTSENNYWIADAGKYANNMNMIAFVKNNSGMDYEIGAFVGEEVRGSARPIYIEALDSYMIFMTIFGESNEEITFKYYDVKNDEEENIFTKENVIFSANAVLGSVDNPIAMMFGTEGMDENTSKEINIYPNPAKVNSEINLGMTYDRVEVYNAIGVKVAEYSNVNKLNGIENAGVYVIRIMNDNEIGNYRVVVE